ncbi:MAG: hypothetical protein HC886_15135 [Leptolyngbyaceae cyanobacterium SM1_1_3]|nr:hypothetical protein [Leptolyngbyaceae cyanobacterium SM1_1_3]NJM85270.1 hypothetical protein [Leptolyngbyaceae cyanobacterium RM2_2_21]NJN03443.1 hypothetical protein [Leptolyngbyaceae cyanobacterium RM1_1_2]NJO08795.1 hypothetical protein [Leptolyngbyaceae cyanobacterium SL_1_1]
MIRFASLTWLLTSFAILPVAHAQELQGSAADLNSLESQSIELSTSGQSLDAVAEQINQAAGEPRRGRNFIPVSEVLSSPAFEGVVNEDNDVPDSLAIYDSMGTPSIGFGTEL